MNISLFNREYTVRRFGTPKVVLGYVTASHTDIKVSLHVHPSGYNTVQSLPEGERKVKRLEAHGDVELVTSDQDNGVKGDMLYYNGEWYECVSEACYDHTLLSHHNYQFVTIPKDSQGTAEMAPPSEADAEYPTCDEYGTETEGYAEDNDGDMEVENEDI